MITRRVVKKVNKLKPRNIKMQPYVSSDPKDIVYLSADEEELHVIGQATTPMDARGRINASLVEVRQGESFSYEPPGNVEFMDVSPMQIVSVSTALIPFLEHDDANRASHGLEHAASSRAASAPGGSACGHRHGGTRPLVTAAR